MDSSIIMKFTRSSPGRDKSFPKVLLDIEEGSNLSIREASAQCANVQTMTNTYLDLKEVA